MRAIIYRRLSVLRDDDPTLSPNTQEHAARAYCEQQGWDVVSVIDDMDESGSAKGKRLARPGLAQAIDMIHDGEADVLVASRLDRLARNTADGLELSNTVKVATPQLGLLGGSAAGDFTRTLMLALAEMESTQISERVTAGVATARAAGRWTSARVPYGYTTVKGADGGTYLQPDPEQRAVVREIATRYLSGETMNAIVKWLNSEIPTAMGGQWRWTTVSNILHSPLTLRGWTKHRGELVRDADGEPLKITDPLLTPKQAAGIEERQRDRVTRPRKPGRKTDHWCSGLARCGSCGARMHIHRHSSGRERSKVTDLVCGAPAGTCPKRRTIRLSRFETLVTHEILDEIGQEDWVKWETIDTRSDVATERARNEAIIADLAHRMTLPGADVMALAQQLQEAKQAAEHTTQGATFATPITMGDTIDEAWPTMSDHDLTELAASRITDITISQDPRISIHWR